MAYKDRFGITDIKKGKFDNLSISWDADLVTDEKGRYPVLLFIPNPAADEHHHIELKKSEAKILYKWLGDFLEGKETRWEK